MWREGRLVQVRQVFWAWLRAGSAVMPQDDRREIELGLNRHRFNQPVEVEAGHVFVFVAVSRDLLRVDSAAFRQVGSFQIEDLKGLV